MQDRRLLLPESLRRYRPLSTVLKAANRKCSAFWERPVEIVTTVPGGIITRPSGLQINICAALEPSR